VVFWRIEAAEEGAMRLVAMLLAGSVIFAPVPAYSATTCEIKVQYCTDARTGVVRHCQVTTCKDEKGTIVSTDILVLRQGEVATPPGNKPPVFKAPINRAPNTGLTQDY
jgi:hypothetical protein